jgi:transposase
MTPQAGRPDLSQLSHEQKDALIYALLDRVDALVAEVAALKAENAALTARVAQLEAKLNEPPKTPDNSSTPPSKGQKANRDAKTKRTGPRAGSVGRKGGGRALAEEPDQFVTAKATSCRHCGTALDDGDHVLHGRYDKIDLPPVRPVVTRVERYAGCCSCCGEVTVAPVPEGLEDGSPFGPGIVAAAIYLRFWTACSVAPSRNSTGKWVSSSPVCAARGWCAPTKPPCASTDAPAGTGCSRTMPWSSTSSAKPVLRRWWPR